jgi:hypothetical protein
MLSLILVHFIPNAISQPEKRSISHTHPKSAGRQPLVIPLGSAEAPVVTSLSYSRHSTCWICSVLSTLWVSFLSPDRVQPLWATVLTRLLRPYDDCSLLCGARRPSAIHTPTELETRGRLHSDSIRHDK